MSQLFEFEKRKISRILLIIDSDAFTRINNFSY
jgi:hypothetical protein